MSNRIGDLIFKEFKKSIGKNILIIKCSDKVEKAQYAEVLTVIKEKGLVDYTINLTNIQIFLTTAGILHVKKHESWDYSS